MSDAMALGNLDRVTKMQERLRIVAERTGQTVQRVERYFGKAAEAGMRLGEITARPAIVVRDYFSFHIDRLLLQLADINRMKVEVKIFANDQVMGTVKKLRQMLEGIGTSIDVNVKACACACSAPVTQSVQITQISINKCCSGQSKIDTWLDRLQKIADILKTLGEAFESFGSGFKDFAEGIKTFKEIFTGKGKKDASDTSGSGDGKDSSTKDKSKDKDKAKSKAKGNNDSGSKGAGSKSTTTPSVPPKGKPPSTIPTKAARSGGFKGLLKGGSKALKFVGKTASKAAAPLNAAMAIFDIATSDNKPKAVVQAVTSAAGSALGATLGSAILPGVGTVVGGMLGGMAGDALGGFIGDKFFGDKKTPAPPAVPKTNELDLLPGDRSSVAASGSAAPGNASAISSDKQAETSNYNITVDGVTVNFPKEEVDENQLALRIGQQIVQQMNAVMPNLA